MRRFIDEKLRSPSGACSQTYAALTKSRAQDRAGLWGSDTEGWLDASYSINETPNFAASKRANLWKRKVFDQRAMMVAFGMVALERLSPGLAHRPGTDLVDMILKLYVESADKRFVSRHVLDCWLQQ